MLKKLKQKVIISVVIAGILYLAFTIYADINQVIAAFKQFNLLLLPLLLVLSFLNYFARFLKWDYYLSIVKVKMKKIDSLSTFISGLIEIKVEWGQAVNPQQVADALKNDSSIKAVYVQASETSTGVSHDVKALGEIVKRHENTMLVVDAITALGVFDIKTDAWGLDVVITGSQKALMLPPGMAFVSVSDKAWAMADKAKNAAFYFHFKKERENQTKNQTAFTPTVSLIIGLQEVFKMMKAEGLENMFARQGQLAHAMREGIKAAGLALCPKESPSDALTAACAPEGVDGQAVYKNLRVKYGITAAGGQDDLKGKIFRLSHMGYADRFDVITAIAATEMVLKGLGHPVKLAMVENNYAKDILILMGSQGENCLPRVPYFSGQD